MLRGSLRTQGGEHWWCGLVPLQPARSHPCQRHTPQPQQLQPPQAKDRPPARQENPSCSNITPMSAAGLRGPPHMKTFTGETSLCPGCGEPVYFAEKVMSLGRNWHRPCLRCQRCRKTLTAGSHAEHDGVPYCHIPCYGYLFGPKGVNIGDVGCYVYDPVDVKSE
ncbi:cysteine-rich protein 3 isoform X2 [Oryctolagus cuniculus]|uniref:cysteine-rich protein 3 isoform X2 n=1 Tax=Oryctolagus cuniculus TaxID=9986 RepID=UPI00048B6FEB|nr:cysteine-rich protein 3 isoform X2 [Oryctolagus cuniculus]XP_051710673.1 cysteine-rich protein 3 isoform X2 [Oryctolagus cuniculus]